MDLWPIGIKGYSAFPKFPALLKPHHQIVWCHKQDTRWASLTPLLRCCRCILPPQPTGPLVERVLLLCRYAVGVFFSPNRLSHGQMHRTSFHILKAIKNAIIHAKNWVGTFNELIDFNGMSTCVGLFHDLSLGNRANCMFLFSYLGIWFLKDFCTYRIQIIFKRYIQPIDETLEGTTTLGRGGPCSYGHEGELHTLQTLRRVASSLDAD